MRRVAVMCLGILVMGVGIGLFKVSLMGNDPSTALGIAVGDWMGIDFSVTLIAMNCLYFVIELLFARDMVGIGTVVNWFLVGPIASFFEKLFLGAWGQPQGFPQKLLLLGAGVLILSFSCALYQTADVGISPYDSLSLLLARKLPIQYFWCRIFTDAVCGPFFYDLSPYVLGIGHLAQDHGTSVGLIVQIEIFGYPGRLSCADGQDAGGHRI